MWRDSKYVTLACTCLVVSALQDSGVCFQAKRQFILLLADDATKRMSSVGYRLATTILSGLVSFLSASLPLEWPEPSSQDDTTIVIVKTFSWAGIFGLPVS